MNLTENLRSRGAAAKKVRVGISFCELIVWPRHRYLFEYPAIVRAQTDFYTVGILNGNAVTNQTKFQCRPYTPLPLMKLLLVLFATISPASKINRQYDASSCFTEIVLYACGGI